MNKYLLSGLLVLIVLVLMWQDTVDNIGTASPFDPNELVPTGTTLYTIFSHEQFVVFFAALAVLVLIVPLKYWLLILGLALVALFAAILIAAAVCPCPVL